MIQYFKVMGKFILPGTAVQVQNIEWDTDSDSKARETLPPIVRFVLEMGMSAEDAEELVDERLTREYGFCPKRFSWFPVFRA